MHFLAPHFAVNGNRDNKSAEGAHEIPTDRKQAHLRSPPPPVWGPVFLSVILHPLGVRTAVSSTTLVARLRAVEPLDSLSSMVAAL